MVVEGRIKRELPQLTFLVLNLLAAVRRVDAVAVFKCVSSKIGTASVVK